MHIHEVLADAHNSRFDIVDIPLQCILNEEWDSGLDHAFILYDSACRFAINAHSRCINNPHTPLEPKFWPRLRPHSGFIDYKVNAFHQHSHRAECADDHSLRNSSNIGMVTGEEIETAWAALNHLQYSI